MKAPWHFRFLAKHLLSACPEAGGGTASQKSPGTTRTFISFNFFSAPPANRKQAAERNAACAFSLSETLFALVIVSLLAALLFPSFSRFGAKSRDAACLNNLRVLAAASLSYFHEHEGRLFPDKFWYDKGSGIRDYVLPNGGNSQSLERDTAFTCKELKRLHPAKYPQYLNRNYTLNWLAFENHPTTGDPKDERPKRVANIPSPSNMWMITDGSYSLPGIKEAYGVWLRRVEATPPQLAFPHSDRQNTVFFDGHAEPISRDDFYKPKSIRLFWGEMTARD